MTGDKLGNKELLIFSQRWTSCWVVERSR